jgi:hypothetical protein
MREKIIIYKKKYGKVVDVKVAIFIFNKEMKLVDIKWE